MQDHIEERVRSISAYIIARSATVREAARAFRVSKSTVHKDMKARLPRVSPQLAARVDEVLRTNKAERHIRGGMATSRKYSAVRGERGHLDAQP